MCIAQGFRWSSTPIRDWEEASGVYKAHKEKEEVVSASSSIPLSSKQEDWIHLSGSTHTFPAGKYYIGDLCYALGDEYYENIFGGFGYEDGLYQQNNSNHFFFVASTSFGDGLYVGSDGNEFGVDAGILSILPESMMAKNDGGHVYDFKEPVTCKFKNGKFTFESGKTFLRINTAG